MSFLLRTSARKTLFAARAFSSTPSNALARTTIIGRLTAPPEETVTANGKQLIRYSVATSSGPKDNEITSFFRVANFPGANTSEAAVAYLVGLPKGTLVHVEADTRLRLTEDADTGKKIQRLDLVQRMLHFFSDGFCR